MGKKVENLFLENRKKNSTFLISFSENRTLSQWDLTSIAHCRKMTGKNILRKSFIFSEILSYTLKWCLISQRSVCERFCNWHAAVLIFNFKRITIFWTTMYTMKHKRKISVTARYGAKRYSNVHECTVCVY